jgi:hypothetical protein
MELGCEPRCDTTLSIEMAGITLVKDYVLPRTKVVKKGR